MDKFKSVIQWLVDHAKDTEWQVHHAAEDTYCPYCCQDNWGSQDTHNEGCVYVSMMKQCNELLKELEN